MVEVYRKFSGCFKHNCEASLCNSVTLGVVHCKVVALTQFKGFNRGQNSMNTL